MIRTSVLRVVDRVSSAVNALDTLFAELRKDPINYEETRWLFYGLGQLAPRLLPDTQEAYLLHAVKERLQANVRAEVLRIAIEALKQGFESAVANAPMHKTRPMHRREMLPSVESSARGGLLVGPRPPTAGRGPVRKIVSRVSILSFQRVFARV